MDSAPLPPPSPRRGVAGTLRSKPVLAVVAAAVVVVLLGVAGTALLKKSKGEDPVDTVAAGAHLSEILDAVQAGPRSLTDCPFDSADGILLSAPGDLRPDGWQPGSVASGFSDTGRRAITCMADGNALRIDSLKLGVVIGEPRSGDLAEALTEAAGSLEVKLSARSKLHDGEIIAACATPKIKGLTPAPAYCTATFNGTNLAVDVISNAPHSTAELVTTWLRESFDDVLASIESTWERRAASTSTSVGTSGTSTTSTTSNTSTASTTSTVSSIPIP